MSDSSDRSFWNDAYREDPDGSIIENPILNAEIADLPIGSALDLGCGLGANTLKLAEYGWRVVGVDWSEHAIELARSAATKGVDATFIVEDITTWTPPTRFDLVISTFALPGGEKSVLALKTAVSALDRGGTLIVMEWDRSMSKSWGLDEEDMMEVGQIASLLSGLTIEAAEVRSGLETDFFPLGVHDTPEIEEMTLNVVFVRAHSSSEPLRTNASP